MFPLISSLIIGLASCIGWFTYREWCRRAKLPPGPKGYPLIGNAYDIPHHHPWVVYAEWAKTYGDVLSFSVFGRPTILLNSWKAASELLDKRSYNYSDRPRMVLANELMGWEWDFVHMKYSDEWRRHRRVFHQYFQSRNLSSYHVMMEQQASQVLLANLLSNPKEFRTHVKLYVSSVVLKLTYGYTAKPENDFFVSLVNKAAPPLLQVVHAGAHLVEYLPFLKHIPAWFPGANFKREAKHAFKMARDLRDIPFNTVLKSMAEGTAERSFVTDNFSKIETLSQMTNAEEVVRNCAAMAYFAGSDTTTSVLLTFILAMAHYPEAQASAQAEVDRITHKTRLPNFNDRNALPFIEALLLETMRWNPVTPLAVPHRAIDDDVYDGYLIPAGATVTANAWAILHDPEVYPEPFEFRPERHLKGERKVPEPDPTATGAFGFGRRICPGRHLATDSAWLAIVSILSCFTVTKTKDENGNEIEPLIDYTDGVAIQPLPFPVWITPRSDTIASIVDTGREELTT